MFGLWRTQKLICEVKSSHSWNRYIDAFNKNIMWSHCKKCGDIFSEPYE